MKSNLVKLVALLSVGLVLPGTVLSSDAQRQMNVRQGPEAVFDRPVSEIVPGLEGAHATHRNGRVGNEFVFWGYTLASGEPAFLYACAAVTGVDCLERRDKICDKSTKVLSENLSMGQVQKLTCRVMCVTATPAASPCCSGAQESADLQVGLVSCGADGP